MPHKLNKLYPNYGNSSLNLMNARMGNLHNYSPLKTVEGVSDMEKRFHAVGGLAQQDRMIRDKRKTLDQAVLYSYQGALVKKVIYDPNLVMEDEQIQGAVRALINPNKLKPDYDDKVISVGFEYNFKPGDIFEWCNTNTRWIIYLQDLTELAYFKGDIRRCSYEISWQDEAGNIKKTYAAVRGPVETKVDTINKHGINMDKPNYTLHLLLPKNADTLAQFKRYSKFYISADKTICWKVEAIDSISSPGILEINAIEYYQNEFEDDLNQGTVGGLIVAPEDPNEGEPSEFVIIGDTFIKPKKEYIYYIDSALSGDWYISGNKLPVKKEPFEDEEGRNAIKIKWTSSYSGQFDLWYGDDSGPLFDYKKTIVVESLF